MINMKIAILMTAIAGLICAANIYAQNSTLEKRNTQIIIKYYDALNQGEEGYKIIDSLLAKNAVLNEHSGKTEDFRQNIKETSKALPVRDVRILNLVAEGNQIFVRAETMAIQKGPFLGISPTNKQVTIISSTVYQFDKDGKISAVNQLWNKLNIMEQLGFIVLSPSQ